MDRQRSDNHPIGLLSGDFPMAKRRSEYGGEDAVLWLMDLDQKRDAASTYKILEAEDILSNVR